MVQSFLVILWSEELMQLEFVWMEVLLVKDLEDGTSWGKGWDVCRTSRRRMGIFYEMVENRLACCIAQTLSSTLKDEIFQQPELA